MKLISPKDAGLGCTYDLVLPLNEKKMASAAMCGSGLRHGTDPKLVESARDVLAVYIVPPGEEVPSDESLCERLAELSSKYPDVKFELMLAVSRQGMPIRAWSRVAPGVARVEADYHIKPTAPGGELFGYDPRVLASVFAGIRTRKGPSNAGSEDPEDVSATTEALLAGWHRKGNTRLWGNIRILRFKYRSGSANDIPLHSRETLLKSLRMGHSVWAIVRQHGPLDFTQVPRTSETNTSVKLKRALAKAVLPLLKAFWSMTVRRRKFAHFLLLGYNCEIAYRFLGANGFLDSTFFAWAGCWGPDIMLDAMSRFDEICKGDLAFAGATDVFIDVSTGVMMHARFKVETKAPTHEADAEAAKSEIRARMGHLREKFYSQLRDEKPTLAVVKINPSERLVGDEFARGIVERLKAMGGRNFRLLVVCQKADAAFFPKEHPDYELRTVAKFNPDWSPATDIYGDRFGWTRIWHEFAPEVRIAQNKTYKFQKKGHS